MRKIHYLLIIALCYFGCSCSTAPSTPYVDKFNFDFEVIEDEMPIGWSNNGKYATGYKFSVDSTVSSNGKYSITAEHDSGNIGFCSWSVTIPNNYKGGQITLSGYIKTENIQHGYAGLWIKLDPVGTLNATRDNGAKGNSEWEKYTLSLPLQSDFTEEIVVGGILNGDGKAWFDNFSVQIDGEDINLIKEQIKPTKVVDNMFDDGSGIADIIINNQNIKNLKLLGQVWGFIKYYHPDVRKGNFNFDYELFRIMPNILEAKTNNERDSLIINWIEKFGDIEHSNKKEVFLKSELNWISTSGFSKGLETLLNNVYAAKRDNNCYYVKVNTADKLMLTNEAKYEDMDYSDAGYKVLSLYRYWNIIQYLFPYKHLINENWNDVLEEFIPKIISANTKSKYGITVLELISRIHDTHARIYPALPILDTLYGERMALPKLIFINNKPVVSGFIGGVQQGSSGLNVGDVIVSIDNKSVQNIIKARVPYTSASNYPTKLRNIAVDLLRSPNKSINIKYLRGTEYLTTTLETYSQDSALVILPKNHNVIDRCYKKVTPDISYLNMGLYKSQYIAELWSSINNSKGLIIDLRPYPAEYITYSFGTLLMPQPTDFFKIKIVDIKTPGAFDYHKTEKVGNYNPSYYKGKIVILVNEQSQSLSEFTAMAFRSAPNSIIIGSTTAGSDGDITIINLPGGLSTMISGVGIYYPDGKETQRVGIIADIEVHPTIEDIKMGRDAQLEEAIKYINSND